jgi:transposase-like protein
MCGSTNLRKNGRTRTGQQKFHCKDCNAYGTLDTKDGERATRQKLALQLHQERLSQRAIARQLKMSRRTLAGLLEKNLTGKP